MKTQFSHRTLLGREDARTLLYNIKDSPLAPRTGDRCSRVCL